jgi:starch synthase
MPSRFEPAGLVQLEAMRYGCIPIVRRTGGLADTVDDYVPGKGYGSGFVFDLYEPTAMLIALVRAGQAYRNKREWNGLIRRAMSKAFSWDASAREHDDLYRKPVRLHRSDRR